MWDVGIIGAGPGGLRAAWECAQAGLATFILDKKKVIGRPVHCGECLSARAVEDMGLDLPADVIALHASGIRLHFPNGSRRRLIEPGYTLNKDAFEQWLARGATQKGARILLQHDVSHLQFRNNFWEVYTRKGARFKVKLLIDASGASAVANKCLGLNPRFQTVVGLQYTVKNLETDDFIDFYLWPHLAPKGYLWVIPKGERTCNIGMATPPAAGVKARLEQFIQQLGLKNLEIERITGGRIPASGPMPRTYTQRLLIIGDAAGFTNPIFKGGTYLALKSASLAASIAIDAFKHNTFGADHFSLYQSRWRRLFPRYEILLKGRRCLNAFSESQLNLMARYMPDNIKVFSFGRILKTGLEILCTHPGLLVQGGPRVMRAFKYSRARWFGW